MEITEQSNFRGNRLWNCNWLPNGIQLQSYWMARNRKLVITRKRKCWRSICMQLN